MSSMKIKVILSSTRQGRAGEKFAQWVMDELTKRTDAEYELLDLRDYQFPYYDDELPASMLQIPYELEVRRKWSEKIAGADGFIIITPEYNHGYPAVLKSALDAIYQEWNNKPVSFISYGGAAHGSRSVEQLRLVAIELQMAPIREAVHVGIFEKDPVFHESGEIADQGFTKKLHNMVGQLLWWASALKSARIA